MNRYERETAAKNWTLKMADMYRDEINEAIESSVVYESDVPAVGKKESLATTSIQVLDMTTEKAIKKYALDGLTKVGALNFASFKWPGGGFIKGSMAQEEALCHASTLYNVIANIKFKSEYEYNREHQNDGMYDDWAIYSPGIIFPVDNISEVECGILTCPAPNRSASHASTKIYQKALDSRIKFVLDILSSKNLDTVILGAFGCGVFGNDPENVAEVFKKYISQGKYSFKNVVFAIPSGPNLDAFRKVFEK